SAVPTFNGSITGGGGTDTLAATDGANSWAVSGANAGTLNATTTFSGITNLTGGSGTDKLTGVAAGSAWSITGANRVTVSCFNATSTDALLGLSLHDALPISSAVPTFNGSITGGGGTDTLAATDGANSWAVSGANAGTLNATTTFSGITNLTGGSGDDGFVFAAAGTLAGNLAGGAQAAADTLDLSS